MERGFVPIAVLIVALLVVGAAGSFIALKAREGRQAETPASLEQREAPSEAGIAATTAEPHEELVEDKVVQQSPPKPLAGAAPKMNSSPGIIPPPAAPSPTPSSKLASLEREITILYNDARPISPDHYTRLSSELNAEAAAGTDAQTIKKLRDMLEAVNPAHTAATGSTAPPAQKICSDDVKPTLIADITTFSRIQKITAPGSQSSEGPKGHSFIWTNHERVPVYMPLRAVFSSGSYGKDSAESPAQYLLFFEVKDNCNYQIKFDHMDEPVAAIRAQLPQTPAIADSRTQEVAQKIEFQAGDLVGYTSGTNQAGNWDFGLYYMKEKSALGTQYGSYGMHGYAVCWVDYYAAGKQQLYRQLLEGPKLLCSF